MKVQDDQRVKNKISRRYPAVKYAVIVLAVMIAAVAAVQLVPGGTEVSSADVIEIDLNAASDLTGVTWDGTNMILTFTAAANGQEYTVTGGGALDIVFENGVSTTVTIDGIDITGNIELNGTASVNLLLSGTSTVTGNIIVPSTATIIIDSADSLGSSNGSLTVAPNGAVSDDIAGIGGSAADAGNITINGGTVTATGGGNAAGIGGGNGGAGGTVSITGGTVTATGGTGAAGIGGGAGGTGSALTLGGTADIKAYSSGDFPAFHADTLTSSVYYVNLILATGSAGPSVFAVYLDETKVAELTLPAGYRSFAFLDSSSSIASEDYDIYLKLTDGRMPMQVMRDDGFAIFSVNTLDGYDSVGGVNGSLMTEMLVRYTDVNGEAKTHSAAVLTQADFDSLTTSTATDMYYDLDDSGPGGGWFIIEGDVTIPEFNGGLETHFTIHGDVRMIIANGSTLTVDCADGIHINNDDLWIYSQPEDGTAMGVLSVSHSGIIMMVGVDHTFTNTAQVNARLTMSGTTSFVTNGVTGTIQSGTNQTAITLSSSHDTVVNYGTIIGSNNGVYLGADGTVNNYATGFVHPGDDTLYGEFPAEYRGVIRGGSDGVYLVTGDHVNNYGTMIGTGIGSNNGGVYSSGGSAEIINYTGGIIEGFINGIYLHDGGIVSNYGRITGNGATSTTAGIYSGVEDVTIVNYTGGTIEGARNGIYLNGGIATIDNYSLIRSTGPTGHGIHAVAGTALITNHDTVAVIGGGDPVRNCFINGAAAGIYISGTTDSEIINSGVINSGVNGIESVGDALTLVNSGEINGHVILADAVNDITLTIGSYIGGNFDISASAAGSTLDFIGTSTLLKLDPNDMTFSVAGGIVSIGTGTVTVNFDAGVVPAGSKNERILLIDGTGTASGSPADPAKANGYLISIAGTEGDLIADPEMEIVNDDNGGPDGRNYYITATSDTGTKISPGGTVTVKSGGSRTFSFSANEGYYISAVTVDGKNLSQAEIDLGYYTFTKVNANHTIRVLGSGGAGNVMTLTINIVEGSGHADYSINGNDLRTYSAPVYIPEHADITVKALADEGYEFSGWGNAGGLHRNADYALYDQTESLYLELHFTSAGGLTDNGICILWWILVLIVLLIIAGLLLFLFFRRKYCKVIKIGHSAEIIGADRAYMKKEYAFTVEGYSGAVFYRIGDGGEWKTLLPGLDGKYVIPKGEITDTVTIEQR